MADYPIYRLVKGTQLTFTEMDDNLRWLSQNMSGSQVTITGSTISMTGSVIINGDLQVYGTASIGFLNTVAFSTGSNQLGNDTLDTQTLIGRVNISGSMVVSGSAIINDLTGSLFGTASWARNAISSSYALSASFAQSAYTASSAISSSYAISASYAVSSSFAQSAYTASSAISASYAISSSFAVSSSYAVKATNADTASWAINALTASSADDLYVRGSLTASAALITGTITAQTLVVQTVTSSVIYSSGSNRFGNELTNQQTFTGSVSITGSLSVKDIPQGNYSNVVVLDTASGDFYVTASSGVGSISPIAVIQNTNLYSLQPKAAVPGVAAVNSIYLGSGSGEGINDNDSVNSVIIGFQAGGGNSNSDAQNSTWIGYQAGYNASYAERSILIGYQAGAIDGLSGPELNDSNFLGYQAGYSSSFAYESNFLGYQAGYSASDARASNFLGRYAGREAENADNSNFLGDQAGFNAKDASNSNFLGDQAGLNSYYANNSNFIGQRAGADAPSASFSNLFGYRAGYNATIGPGINSNNIVIGTNITLPDNTRDSINIGGLIFGTGSHSDAGAVFPFDQAVTNGRVGINTSTPTFNFDVSGSGRYTNGLQVTGSLRAPIITGSLFGTSSWSQNSVTASNFAGTGSNGFVSNMSDTYTGTAKITDIVSLSSAEYAAIVSPSTSTLYIII